MPATFGVIVPTLQKCPHSTHLLAVRRIGIHAPKILRAVQPALDGLDRCVVFGCGFHGNALPREDRIGPPDCGSLSEEMQRTHSPPGKPLSSFQDFSEWSVVKRRPSPQTGMNQEYCIQKPLCTSREKTRFLSGSFSTPSHSKTRSYTARKAFRSLCTVRFRTKLSCPLFSDTMSYSVAT